MPSAGEKSLNNSLSELMRQVRGEERRRGILNVYEITGNVIILVFFRDHASGERPERILDLHEQFRDESLQYSCSYQLFDIDQISFKMVINFIQSNSSAGRQELSYFNLKRRLLRL